jgi:hypothetical protein
MSQGENMSQNNKLVKSRRNLYLAIIAAVVVVSVTIVIRYGDIIGEPSPYPGVGKPGSDHQHTKFRVYIDGNRVPFTDQNYFKRSEYIFLEEGDGNTIHRFATGATLAMFFKSIGWELTDTCIKTDKIFEQLKIKTTEYCNEGNRTLKVYVNDKLIGNAKDYVLWENDRILVTFGSQDEAAINIQLSTLKPLPLPPGGIPGFP